MLRTLLIIQTLIATASWSAWYIASRNDELSYFVQKSFFLPIPLAEVANTKIISLFSGTLPSWLLCLNNLHIPSFYKIINSIAILLIIIAYAWLFTKIIAVRAGQGEINKQDWFMLLAIALVTALILPGNSSDIFRYISVGVQQLDYAQNPYVTVLADIENWRLNPLLTNMRWEHNPCPYGPVFAFISKLLMSFNFKSLWLSLLIFKLFNFFSYAALLTAFYFILTKIKEQLVNNWTVEQIFFLFALNPLLMIQGLWNGHNDMLLALLSFAPLVFILLQNEKLGFNLAIFFLLVSLAVKYITLVLIPIFLVWIWKRQRYFPYYGFLLGLLVLYLGVDYYNLQHIDYSELSHNATLAHKSLFDLVNTIYKFFSKSDLPKWSIFIALFTYAIFYLYLFIRFFLSKEEMSMMKLMRYLTLVYAVLLLIISPKFHSWYLISLLPFAAISYPSFTLALSLGHLLSISFIDQAHILNYLLMTVVPVVVIARSAIGVTRQSNSTLT